jgi:cytochrome c oxidase subunit 2
MSKSIIKFQYIINLLSSESFECDAPDTFQLKLQDPATSIMEGLLNFNKHLLFIIITIVLLVAWLLFATMSNYEEFNSPRRRKFFHSNALEVVWTSLPAITLLSLASPSFNLLYSMDEVSAPELSIKVIGHQWFWSYEMSDFYKVLNCAGSDQTLKYTCYLLTGEEFYKKDNVGFFRLLETNKRLLLPSNTHLRMLITSVDVLHSWTVPSFGVKIDACPGRLNQVNIFLKRVGIFFGQCSEICGVNHGFMPIVVMVVSSNQFSFYLMSKNLD